jgi:SWI/SNF-related matrix-associated actin-dependent regulator 1 of chromatin subfamily A
MDSGKVDKLIELLHEHKESGSRTLIFSQYAKVLDILGRVLETENVTHVRLDGTTPTEDRLALIDKFNDDDSIQAFMITTRSGGAGINLATADKVIIFDPSFNPQDDVQAANRAHRIGQTRPVEVVTLVTKGTIEEQIYKLGLSKLALDQRVAGADDEGDGDKASAKVEKANMKRIEDMLMKGQTTPQDESEAEKEDEGKKDSMDVKKGGSKLKQEVGSEGEVKKEPEVKKSGMKLKIKVKADPDAEKGKLKSKDIRDAFLKGMEEKGVKMVKEEK